MTDDSIIKKVLKNLGQIGEETAKETLREIGEMTEKVITGQELLGIKPISDEELEKKKADDEKKKQEELTRLRQQQSEPGRNVEEEIKRVREEKEREKEQEKRNLEQIRQQQAAGEAQGQQAMNMPGNAKKEAAKHQMSPGKRKKQQPDPTQTSQTSEFKGGKID
jgi:hypothetical protein